MRWLVVGCGSIGLQHLQHLNDAGQHDVAVIDPRLDISTLQQEQDEADAELAAYFAAGGKPADADWIGWNRSWIAHQRLADIVKWRERITAFTGKKRAVTSWDDAPEADVALICTPTHQHVNDANTALDHGLHLVIEKPVGMDATGGEALCQRVAANEDRYAMVACPMRFHPGAIEIKKIVDEGKLGDIFFARSWYRQALEEWRPGTDYRMNYSAHRAQGGGLFLDRIHEIDFMRFLFGEPQQVRAAIAHTEHYETDIEHTAFGMLLFGKLMATIGLDCITPGYHCGMELVGTKGQMGCDFAPTVNGMVQRQGLDAGAAAQLQHWIAVLEGREDPAQPLIAAYRVLYFVQLLYKSAQEGTWLPV